MKEWIKSEVETETFLRLLRALQSTISLDFIIWAQLEDTKGF